MRAVIVGSGPSARGFVPPDDVRVIAVNGVIDWISRADYWFTLDPSHENRERLYNKRRGVMYCVALPSHYPHINATRFERVAERRSEPSPEKTPEWWLWRWSAVCGLCDEPGKIHTGNSAWGALGLAYHLGAEKVALVGVDASDKARIEGGEPNNLSHLPLLFNSAINQIDMVNCGMMESQLPQMTIAEGMEWLRA